MAPVAALTELIAFLDDLLEPGRFDDYGPNGLQVPGREDVTVVATGVSAGRELFERAIAAGAGLVLMHHGLFWKNLPLAIDRPGKARLQLLFEHDVALAAYHLPLDAHPEIGNNALLAAALGAEPMTPFPARPEPDRRRRRIARRRADPRRAAARTARPSAPDPLVFVAGPDRVAVGIVSGGGPTCATRGRGLDALVTGEPSEPVMGEAREYGIHFLAGGHYATETFGIRRLGELIAERFEIDHEFIDVPNPV